MRRSLWLTFVIAVALLVPAAPGVAAAPSPSGEVVPQFWAVGTLDDPDARGVVGVVDAGDLAIWTQFTLIGLRPDARYRVDLSAQSCAEDFVTGFPYSFTANSKGHRSASYSVENVVITSLRSARIRVRRTGTWRPVACGSLRLYDAIDQQGSTTLLRELGRTPAAGPLAADTAITIFRGPEAKGIIVHGNAGNDEIRLRAVTTGLAASKRHVLIGGVAGCDSPWSTSQRAAKVWVDIDRTGAAYIDETTPPLLGVAAGDVNGDGIVDAADYVAWRIKRASGQSVGCYEVDARLSRHQS